jgi:acetylornithine deacetylase/succinyl-diaminopimelate desuccinylase-like protein
MASIYGRGACDMNCGTTAALFTFLYLRELRAELDGRLTLSVVSEEETFGPLGRPLTVQAAAGNIRRQLSERRAEQPLDITLRRKGPAVARIYSAHQRRAWCLYARQ